MLTTAESDARHLRRNNAKVLRLTLKVSKCLAREKESVEAERHAREQAHAIRCMSGYMSSVSESTATTKDDDPPVAHAVHGVDRPLCRRLQGQGLDQAVNSDHLRILHFILFYFLCSNLTKNVFWVRLALPDELCSKFIVRC